tara:strand:- start:113 stop:316 length:204 start_codon:yes stop_codon:yes gene_type:complete
VKNTFSSITDKLVAKYKEPVGDENIKSTNINVLLNRVKQDRKKEGRKKLLFTAATSLGVVLFGILVF